jgi:phage terminase small subunit
MADEKKLTAKEEAFCQSYLIDFNATRAAKAAGYSGRSATEIGSENLRKLHIQERINELRENTGKTFNITRERIAQELARIAFADIRNLFDDVSGDLVPPYELSDDAAAVIGSIEIDALYDGVGKDRTQIGLTKKVKTWEKTKALEALNRMMGFNAPDEKKISGSLDIKQIGGMEIT